MAKGAGAKDLVSGMGGSINKTQMLSAVEEYEKYHVYYGGDDEIRKANCIDMANKYYDLSTSFYEYGWGKSFHFANSCTSVTGLNNNAYQIARGTELNRLCGLDKTCGFVKGDFMKMPFSNDSFDAIYAIEATCHAPDAVGCYKEIKRVLKPGQLFAAYEWCMTGSFDPKNEEHQKIKAEIELGDGLPDIRTTSQCLEALKSAGFEVLFEEDLAVSSPLPWYLPLDTSHFSLSSFRLTSLGRFLTRNMVRIFELLKIAPEGSQRVSAFLEKAAEGLVSGGRKEIFTPMYFFLARKPISDN